MLAGLNHITLAVTDVDRSLEFYTTSLGFRPILKWDAGAYLTLGDLWFCLSRDDAKPSQDYSHISFDIASEHFESFCETLLASDVRTWKENSSEGNSLYILDPDDHKLEIHVGSLETRLNELKSKPYTGLEWF